MIFGTLYEALDNNKPEFVNERRAFVMNMLRRLVHTPVWMLNKFRK
jgi:hypothetical protein